MLDLLVGTRWKPFVYPICGSKKPFARSNPYTPPNPLGSAIVEQGLEFVNRDEGFSRDRGGIIYSDQIENLFLTLLPESCRPPAPSIGVLFIR